MTVKVVREEQTKGITTRSGVQLLEINTKRSVAIKENAHTTIKEQLDEFEQNKKIKTNSISGLKVKKIAHTKEFMPSLPFSQSLLKRKLDDQFEKFINMLKKL